jgi:cytochrome c556
MRSLVKSRLVKLGLVALGALATAQAVNAQDAPATPEDAMAKAVADRQAVFKLIAFNSDQVMAMLKKKAPFDAAKAAMVGSRLEVLAPMIPETFAAADTRKASNVKTKAREGIWSNAADFKAKADELAKASSGLTAAAKSGDQGATMKAAIAVGKACSGCHDNYRDK